MPRKQGPCLFQWNMTMNKMNNWGNSGNNRPELLFAGAGSRLTRRFCLLGFRNSATLLDCLEEGKLLRYILGAVVFVILVYVLISGIDFFPEKVTTVYRADEAVQYHVRKVSQIPREIEKEEMEKLAVEEENLTKEEIIERYYGYVVGKIEMNKVYPQEEQSKGHEGTVLLNIVIARNGKIEKVTILNQPRYMKLTAAAVEAIRRALPLEPYSRLIEQERLMLKVEINFFLK